MAKYHPMHECLDVSQSQQGTGHYVMLTFDSYDDARRAKEWLRMLETPKRGYLHEQWQGVESEALENTG